MRGGKRLVDGRAPAELQIGAERRAPSTAISANPRAGTTRSRFDDVVELERATQALKQLGFTIRAAKRALERARAHVGTDADVPILGTTVLALQRDGQLEADEPEAAVLATQALVQAGFERSMAEQAVAAARAHVITNVELAGHASSAASPS